MDKQKVVVSLGHDALGYTTLEQWDAVHKTAGALADLVEANYQLTITSSRNICDRPPPGALARNC